MKNCTNPLCLTEYEPNVNGAVRDYCARCYRYSTRHQGLLPGPKGEAAPPTRAITIRIPVDLDERVSKVSDLPIATWVRKVAEAKLEELELELRLKWKGAK